MSMRLVLLIVLAEGTRLSVSFLSLSMRCFSSFSLSLKYWINWLTPDHGELLAPPLALEDSPLASSLLVDPPDPGGCGRRLCPGRPPIWNVERLFRCASMRHDHVRRCCTCVMISVVE